MRILFVTTLAAVAQVAIAHHSASPHFNLEQVLELEGDTLHVVERFRVDTDNNTLAREYVASGSDSGRKLPGASNNSVLSRTSIYRLSGRISAPCVTDFEFRRQSLCLSEVGQRFFAGL